MNIVVYTLFSFLSIFNIYADNEIDKSIFAALKKGDAKALSTYFTSSVKVSIYREEQVATKFQAELIVSDFLNDNKLSEVRRNLLGNENVVNCLIYEGKSNKKQVRILVKIVKLKNSEFISEFRVE